MTLFLCAAGSRLPTTRSIEEQLAERGGECRVPQLRQRSGLDLADAFARQVEVGADLSERARFTAVEARAQHEDVALALREWRQMLEDLVGQQRRCRCVTR